MDEVTIGARYYNNTIGPQRVDGFSRTDVAEVLLYSRVLSSAEMDTIEKYVEQKYASVKNSLPSDSDGPGEPLETIVDPPPVQVFVPGFSVRQLPLKLSNINNVKYRSDGTLVALGYDGRIWLLRDTDGDGIEDKTTLFWSNESGLRAPIGMDLTPPGYVHGEGVFVVGKTRCVLIADTDGDDHADREIDIASGWKESFHPVDGLGVAFDPRDGSIYYGRGTYNFADPLLRDKDGKSQYDLKDESGAIIHVSPDFKSREIVATGIRFPVAIRLNERGDLFATDQEGATWVPNGNPLDELLHIQKGRHYGFPARHPHDLPNVIDEPSAFDFGPQHQSICGFNFNHPVRPGGPIFGPDGWAGDALVTGYSRGKLYRTQLIKSQAGYVAKTQLLACLNMLTVDTCVGPDGSLLVACHSGGPDWGSGPTGPGKFFKIEYVGRALPQPVLTWAASPHEVRVEFDRPIDPQSWHGVLNRAKLTAGRYVRAGDRFESLWPGYAAVQRQKLTPRFNVPLESAQITSDGRTLVMSTRPMTQAVEYALTLPAEPTTGQGGIDVLPQHSAIDLDFDLTGCEVSFIPTSGGPAWTGWLPHYDLVVSRQLTAGSATHDALWAAVKKGGKLALRGQIDLVDMLRPAVQPGSTIDYQYPPEDVTVSFKTSTHDSRLQLIVPSEVDQKTSDGSQVSFTVRGNEKKLVPVEIQLSTTAATPTLSVEWTTNEDNRPRPLPLRRLLVPWADTSDKNLDEVLTVRAPELEGGSWAKGYREFFGPQATCSKCHTIYKRGTNIGPDLSNLIHRDYASVLRDITHPSFAINPDYLPYIVTRSDGRVLAGVVHTSGDNMTVGDPEGNVTQLSRSDIDRLEPSAVSTMPEGIPKLLGPDRMRDLLTFLLTPPPQHAPRSGRSATETANTGRSTSDSFRCSETARECATNSRRARGRTEGSRPRRTRLSGLAKIVGGVACRGRRR